MGTSRNIRTAGLFDCGRLADFRIRFVQDRFQGYLPPDTLIELDRETIKSELQQWMREGCTEDYIDLDGQVTGLIVYKADAEKAEGWIELVEILTPADAEHKFALIDQAVEQMRRAGCRVVHLWLLKDNFRARFLFQHYGFHQDEGMRTINRKGYNLLQVRYSLYPENGQQSV